MQCTCRCWQMHMPVCEGADATEKGSELLKVRKSRRCLDLFWGLTDCGVRSVCSHLGRRSFLLLFLLAAGVGCCAVSISGPRRRRRRRSSQQLLAACCGDGRLHGKDTNEGSGLLVAQRGTWHTVNMTYLHEDGAVLYLLHLCQPVLKFGGRVRYTYSVLGCPLQLCQQDVAWTSDCTSMHLHGCQVLGGCHALLVEPQPLLHLRAISTCGASKPPFTAQEWAVSSVLCQS